LISKCFDLTPENLWITLLKTCLQGRQALTNQGLGQIAHQMGSQIKSSKINNLAACPVWRQDAVVCMSGKVARPFFVHKSRGEVCNFAKKPHFWRVCVLAEFFGFQAAARK
jgi:hypothetical protein